MACKTGYSLHPDTRSSMTSFLLSCGADGAWSTPYSMVAKLLTSADATKTVCAVKQKSCAVGKKHIQHGQSYKVECNNCNCNDGTLSCTKEKCGCKLFIVDFEMLVDDSGDREKRIP